MAHFVVSGEPRFVFHTAIEPTDPAPPEGANPRRSIEARCVVVHFDRGIPGKPSNMAPVGRSQPKARDGQLCTPTPEALNAEAYWPWQAWLRRTAAALVYERVCGDAAR